MIEVRVDSAPFDLAADTARLAGEGVGAVASFVGVVRGGDGLVALTLEHYPGMTEAALQALARTAAARWTLSGVIVHHRVGRLVVGTPIVLAACASPHRHDALKACAYLIDRLKTDAPLWKRESFANGTERWVEPRAADTDAASRWAPGLPKLAPYTG